MVSFGWVEILLRDKNRKIVCKNFVGCVYFYMILN